MFDMDFDKAFDILIGHEGGYVNHPRDPGGETHWGVTKRSYPKENIRKMTKARAKVIYKRDFWDPCSCDHLPVLVRYPVLDAAVNSGPSQAIRWLQAAAGVAVDGKLGPITMGAVLEADGGVLLARMMGERLQFMSDLSIWDTFSEGWAKRVAAVLRMAPARAPRVPTPIGPVVPQTVIPLSERVTKLEERVDALEKG